MKSLSQKKQTLGQKVADKVAKVGSSWIFIICFGIFLLLWMAFNSLQILWMPFDPYPFILLNLILSCLAAIQAPIIMISQRRMDERERELAEHDLEIDIETAKRLERLEKKIDQLISKE